MRPPWNLFGAVIAGSLVVAASAVLASDHRDPHPMPVKTSSTVWTRPPTTTTVPVTTTAPTTTTVPPTTTTTVRAAVAPPTTGRSLGTFKATCYGAFEGYGGNTFTGEQSGPGSIAVDPRVIRMGTHLSAVGIGRDAGHNYAGHADDRGGAIKGARLDVWFRTKAECDAWGTRDVEVFAQ